MKVLWLTENYPPKTGGMAQSCDRIVRGLGEAGITIDVVQFCGPGKPLRGVQRQHGLHILCPVEDDPGHAANLVWNLVEREAGANVAAGGNGYTHVVAFGGWLPIIVAPVFAAWLQAPLITMLRGNDFDTALFSPKRGDALREAMSRSAHVCTVSQDKADKVRRLFPHVDVTCTSNGINLDEWRATTSEVQRAAQWRNDNVSDGRKVLGLFGHLKAKKGCTFFLQALEQSGCADRFHILLVGELDDEPLSHLKNDYTLQPYIDRLDLIPYYLACDWLVIPSFYEGFPNVLLEAGALSVPLIAARTGGMRDLPVWERFAHAKSPQRSILSSTVKDLDVPPSETSILFEPGDLHDCRLVIQQAAQIAEDKRIAMGKRLHEVISDNFRESHETQRYLDVFNHVHQRHSSVRLELKKVEASISNPSQR
jgi:glycogen(starch) synthase